MRNKYDDYEDIYGEDEDYEDFYGEDEDDDEDAFDDWEEKSPLERWKKYKEEGGFYDYGQWLEENGYIKIEEWAPIPEFEGYLEASNMGRIKNTWTGNVLKQTTNKKGYKSITVNILGQQYTREVHRLVASAFIDGEHTGMDVHHKDGNKANNKLSNLEYCTRKENVRHAIEDGLMKPSGFGKKPIKVKCIENGKIYNSIRECSKDIGIDQGVLSYHFKDKIKATCKGYTFEKVEEEGGSDGREVD